jgi:hypothetical protein
MIPSDVRKSSHPRGEALLRGQPDFIESRNESSEGSSLSGTELAPRFVENIRISD